MRSCAKTGIKGDFTLTKNLWALRDQYVGRQVTVRYFERTPDNIPRFPVAVDFHIKTVGRVD